MRLSGKRSFMSPEYLMGSPAEVRSDVFSAGIVLFMCLTGVHPFARPTVAASLTALVGADAVPLASLRAGVPAELARVAGRALKREPTARFASALDMQIALEALPGIATAAQVGTWVKAVLSDVSPTDRELLLEPARISLRSF